MKKKWRIVLPPLPYHCAPSCPTAEMASQGKYWMFTLNNPVAPIDLAGIPNLTYGVYQGEVGEEGTPHYQGYLEFERNVRLCVLQISIPGAHFEKRRGNADQARDYCMKEDTREEDPVEFGVFGGTGRQGARVDLEAAAAAVAAGADKDAIFIAHPEVFAKYPRFVAYALDKHRRDNVAKVDVSAAPRPFQAQILELLAAEPHDREVIWVVDTVGGRGKTHLSKHLVDQQGAFYCNGGKHSHITFAYAGERVVIFDFVRDAESYVQYGVIEQIKNGIMFSSKYESGLKRCAVPHVLVFSNFEPDQHKMSADRWRIIRL